MLLIVTIGLVLVGAVALVIGFVSNSLGPIYLSIACSVIAGIVLVVFSRMSRRREDAVSTAPAAPSPGSWSPASTSAPAAAPTAVPSAPPAPPPPPPAFRPERSRPMAAPAVADEARDDALAVDTVGDGASDDDLASTSAFAAPAARVEDEDDDFPIPGYDRLRASQIVARLGDLDLDELDMVREREEQGKNRSTVIRRVDERIDELEAEEAAAPAAAVATAPAHDEDDFPIPGYDRLDVDEIIPLLDDLSDEELDLVADREEQGRNRIEILDYIDDMFEDVDVDVGQPAAVAEPEPEPVAVVPEPAPVPRTPRKAPATKAPTRAAAVKAAATKATPRKAAAKAAPAKAPSKAAGGRAAAKKQPAAKAATTVAKLGKVATKKAAATKAGVTRATKAAPAAKGGVKKLVPVAKRAPVKKR